MTYETNHIIKGFEHVAGGRLLITRYPNKEVALLIGRRDGIDDDFLTATVALEDAPRAAPGAVWLKGWSENAGVPQALESADLVRLTGVTHPAGFVHAELAELMPLLAEDVAAYLKMSVR